MRKFLLFLFISLFNIYSDYGQTVFKKVFNIGSQGRLFTISNSNYAYCYGAGLAKLDSIGNVYFSRSYFPSMIVTDLLKLNENKYVIIGASADTCHHDTSIYEQPTLCFVDSMGIIQTKKYYESNGVCGGYPAGFTSFLKSDGGILFGGAGFEPGIGYSSGGFLLSVDFSGQLNWAKYFSNHRGGAKFAAELTDHSVIAGLNIDSGGAVLARLDSGGNLLWSKSYVRPRGYLHSILPESDGTFLITGTTDSLKINLGDQYPPWFHPTLFVMKIDTSGQVLWAKEYDDSTGINNYFSLDVSHLIKLVDGSYMLYCGKYTNSNPSVVLIIHLDINGNVLWNRSHGPHTLVNQCQFITSTSDGGYLMSESTLGNYPNGWLAGFEVIKTDSEGHSVGCFEYTENINCYPYFPIDSNVLLITINGGAEYNANVIDTSYGTTAMYDECILLSNGNPFIIDKSNETIVYPNPTTGKTTIQSNGQRPRPEGYVTVYDSMGRIVLQKPITKEEDKQIDLSKQSKGIYLLRIKEGVKMSDRKLVVE